MKRSLFGDTEVELPNFEPSLAVPSLRPKSPQRLTPELGGKRFAGVRLGFRFSLWWTEIVDSRQPFPAHHEFLVVFVAQSRFAGRLEVVADGFDRFFEKLILVETFGPGRIFSQRIRFKNQHIGCGHAKVGLLRP